MGENMHNTSRSTSCLAITVAIVGDKKITFLLLQIFSDIEMKGVSNFAKKYSVFDAKFISPQLIISFSLRKKSFNFLKKYFLFFTRNKPKFVVILNKIVCRFMILLFYEFEEK